MRVEAMKGSDTAVLLVKPVQRSKGLRGVTAKRLPRYLLLAGIPLK